MQALVRRSGNYFPERRTSACVSIFDWLLSASRQITQSQRIQEILQIALQLRCHADVTITRHSTFAVMRPNGGVQ